MLGVEFRDASGLSPLRIVIPGKASLPGPGLVPVPLLELFAAVAEFPPSGRTRSRVTRGGCSVGSFGCGAGARFCTGLNTREGQVRLQ